jgi:hypothetical protein
MAVSGWRLVGLSDPTANRFVLASRPAFYSSNLRFMEINPIRRSIEDLTERSGALRRFL